jgi:hypothetical protein
LRVAFAQLGDDGSGIGENVVGSIQTGHSVGSARECGEVIHVTATGPEVLQNGPGGRVAVKGCPALDHELAMPNRPHGGPILRGDALSAGSLQHVENLTFRRVIRRIGNI